MFAASDSPFLAAGGGDLAVLFIPMVVLLAVCSIVSVKGGAFYAGPQRLVGWVDET